MNKDIDAEITKHKLAIAKLLEEKDSIKKPWEDLKYEINDRGLWEAVIVVSNFPEIDDKEFHRKREVLEIAYISLEHYVEQKMFEFGITE